MTPEGLDDALRVHVESRAGWTLVHVAGELDYDTARIWDEGAAGDASVAVEMSRLSFADTAGITCPVHAHQRAQQLGARIVFLRPSAQVRRLLAITGLSERLPVRDELPSIGGATT